jgi:hypothetical protein
LPAGCAFAGGCVCLLIHGHDPCPEGYRVPNDVQIIIDCCADKATYILLPMNAAFTHEQIVSRIKPLKS